MDAFNDRLLLFLLSLMSFSLLTLLTLSFDGDEVALIVLVPITAFRGGNDMLRIFNSCLRSKAKKKAFELEQLKNKIAAYLLPHPSIFVD